MHTLLGAWSRLEKMVPGATVVVAVEDTGNDPEVACLTDGGAVRLASDPGQRAASRFNAKWLPRAYAFDESGRLTYVQPPTASDTDALQQVVALWQRP